MKASIKIKAVPATLGFDILAECKGCIFEATDSCDGITSSLVAAGLPACDEGRPGFIYVIDSKEAK